MKSPPPKTITWKFLNVQTKIQVSNREVPHNHVIDLGDFCLACLALASTNSIRRKVWWDK